MSPPLLHVDRLLSLQECLRGGIPVHAQLPLFETLVGLRTRRLEPDEFWRRWETLAADDGGILPAIRAVVQEYLNTRDLPPQPGWGCFGQESPDRMAARSLFDSILRHMKHSLVGSEALPADAPAGRGDEPTAPGDGP